MGVVYKAEDTKLGRTVALKVLPPERVADPNRKRRFIQEARAASALNHPNIITIHDIDEAEGVHFIAMEYVQGKTLDRLIARHGLRLNEALKYAVQMAAALAKAHSAGIVHRDLKPTNVMVTDDGLVKVLDFGLAKLTEAAPTSEAETIATVGPVTEEGTIVGTVGYMSPEQAEGKPVDARSDIFGFGSVLYEMLTGQRAFQGETKASTIAAILREEPKLLSQAVEGLPRELERLVKRCLRKDREHRFQTMADLKVALEEMKEESDSGELAERVTTVGQNQALPYATAGRALLIGGALIVLVGLLLGLNVGGLRDRLLPKPPPELSQRALTANLSENAVVWGAISPDGKYLVYSDMAGMHLKLVETEETRLIPQPQGPAPDPAGWWPGAWFPDGTKFLATGIEATPLGGSTYALWVVSVMGGPPRKLRGDASFGSVSPDGSLIAFTTGVGFMAYGEVWVVGAQGEEARKLVPASEDDGYHPTAWSPDGRRVVYRRYHRSPGRAECSIETRDLKGGPPTTVLSDPRLCRLRSHWWSPEGRLIFTMPEPEPNQNDENLWEIRVDTRTGKPLSKPRRITNWAGVVPEASGATADGKSLTITKWTDQAAVYVGELEASGRRLKQPRRLTLEKSNDYPSAWTPDSKAVLFVSDRNRTQDIFRQSINQDSAEQVVTGPNYKDGPVVSPDGSWILYREHPANKPTRIMRVPVSGGTSQLVLEGGNINGHACAKSPATLCVYSEETSDGKQLIFSAFHPTQRKARELAKVTLKQPTWGYSWDVSPDGSRLAFAEAEEREGRIRLIPLAGAAAGEVIVKGWFAVASVAWAADGKGLFVAVAGGNPVTLLSVDLEGRAQVLWQQRRRGDFSIWCVPSPDGRHLAIAGRTVDSNLWLLENF
jgi:serine/threonine protein kinase/Tol biopolymer transport system component